MFNSQVKQFIFSSSQFQMQNNPICVHITVTELNTIEITSILAVPLDKMSALNYLTLKEIETPFTGFLVKH